MKFSYQLMIVSDDINLEEPVSRICFLLNKRIWGGCPCRGDSLTYFTTVFGIPILIRSPFFACESNSMVVRLQYLLSLRWVSNHAVCLNVVQG